MRVRYSPLGQQFAHVDSVFEELRALVASGDFTLGKPVQEFEAMFASAIVPSVIISSALVSYPVTPFIIRTVMVEVDTVTIVAVPGRIGIISCFGIIISYGSGCCITILTYGSRLVNYRSRYGYRQTDVGDGRKRQPYMCVHIYL